MHDLTFFAMGCQMRMLLEADGPAAAAAVARVPRWFEGWEQYLSRFRPDSELCRLNRRAGSPVPVSLTLWEALEVAMAAARDSDGLVTPALLPALLAAGYDRSFDTLAAEGEAVPTRFVAAGDWRAIRRRAGRRLVHLPPGVQLDLGGTAKGWAADRAAARLAATGPALVDAGGDIAVSGPRLNGSPWPIAVGTADDDAPNLAEVGLLGGGIATSGTDHRRWRRGGVWQHHLIDPRTGRPAETDIVTATVIAPSTVEAEIGAKVALLLGSRAGLAWVEARPGLAALLLRTDGECIVSRRWPAYRWQGPFEEALAS